MLTSGTLNACAYALYRVGQAISPDFEASIRTFPIHVPAMAVASALLNGVVYIVSGLGILRGSAWAVWVYVVYVPALSLLVVAGMRQPLSFPEAFWTVPYVVFIVLLARRSSREFFGFRTVSLSPN